MGNEVRPVGRRAVTSSLRGLSGFDLAVLLTMVALCTVVWQAAGAGPWLALPALPAALVIGGKRRRADPWLSTLDRETRRYSKKDEWRRLLEIEQARSAGERRLLLAREFRRLAEEMLAAPPADRRKWPPPGRMSVIRRQANLLIASASDRQVSFLPEDRPGDALTGEDLTAAARCLAGYTTLLLAVYPVPRWDLELLRVIVRERTRLQIAYDSLANVIRNT